MDKEFANFMRRYATTKEVAQAFFDLDDEQQDQVLDQHQDFCIEQACDTQSPLAQGKLRDLVFGIR